MTEFNFITYWVLNFFMNFALVVHIWSKHQERLHIRRIPTTPYVRWEFFDTRHSRVGVRCNACKCLKMRKVTIEATWLEIGNNSWIVETFFVCYIKMTFFLSRVCTFKTITCDKNLIQCKNIILWIIQLISSLVNIYLYFYYTNIFLFLKS